MRSTFVKLLLVFRPRIFTYEKQDGVGDFGTVSVVGWFGSLAEVDNAAVEEEDFDRIQAGPANSECGLILEDVEEVVGGVVVGC